MQRIMVATDGSPGANRAVDEAAKLAKATGGELLILTVGGNISGAELRRLADINGDVGAVLESTADQVLARAKKRAMRIGVSTSKLRSA
jgi:nucleotide-binding universal stress UspA family protein